MATTSPTPTATPTKTDLLSVFVLVLSFALSSSATVYFVASIAKYLLATTDSDTTRCASVTTNSTSNDDASESSNSIEQRIRTLEENVALLLSTSSTSTGVLPQPTNTVNTPTTTASALAPSTAAPPPPQPPPPPPAPPAPPMHPSLKLPALPAKPAAPEPATHGMSDVLSELLGKVKRMQMSKEKMVSVKDSVVDLAVVGSDMKFTAPANTNQRKQTADHKDDEINLENIQPPWHNSSEPEPRVLRASTKQAAVLPVDLPNPTSLIKEIPSIRLRRTLIPRTPGGTPQERVGSGRK
ncbi:hypothetical protein HDU79_009963 [Rhizoclosmatium sp. JEL0117]|nr:hypothetical protein HDU79_009963 [Rhizoclosmatium sp. JEL0117]